MKLPVWCDTRLRLTLLLTLLFGLALWFQVDGFNGPAWWLWSWRKLPLLRVGLALFPGGLALAGALVLFERRGTPVPAVCLLVLASLLLQFGAIGSSRANQFFTLTRLHDYILMTKHTGYFQDADTFTGRDWFAGYPELLRSGTLGPHSHNKPPGPILFYAGLRKLVPNVDQAAYVAGVLLALLAAASVAGVFFWLRLLTGETAPAFWGAAWLSLLPGLILFLPQFDQTFPLLTCLTTGLWYQALRRNHAGWAAAAGVALAAGLFVTFNLLVLGVFISLTLLARGWRREYSWERCIFLGTTFLEATVGLGLLLWLSLGYNPVATLLAAIANQQDLAVGWNRPWPQCVPWDLYDFFLGSAFVAVIPVCGAWLRRDLGGEQRRLIVLAVLQVLCVAGTGLLRTETARVWLFLQPFALLALGLDLARWHPWARRIAFLCGWLLLLLIHRHMWFLRG